MLVLSRKAGQALSIGPDIEITVLKVEGELVRLGIQAPRKINILRKELLEDIRRETETAPAQQASPPSVLKRISQRLTHTSE